MSDSNFQHTESVGYEVYNTVVSSDSVLSCSYCVVTCHVI
jgi:hypothetical protein